MSFDFGFASTTREYETILSAAVHKRTWSSLSIVSRSSFLLRLPISDDTPGDRGELDARSPLALNPSSVGLATLSVNVNSKSEQRT
jgi:hypothetical protein